jgi:hypothetical protein
MTGSIPPPIPPDAPKPWGFCAPACFLGFLALAASLPLLWWRITQQPAATTATGEVSGQLAQAFKGVESGPDWYSQLRAGAVIAAFLAIIVAVVGLIQGHNGRLASISLVLAAGALIAASPGLGMTIVAIVIVIVVIALMLGIG